jgi:conjugative transposon TraN protein
MKYLLAIIMLLTGINLQAQTGNSFTDAALIPPFNLDITWHKTTMLIFPAAIQSADRGDSYVLAEKVKGVDNVLKVKAGQKTFESSNLQVITVDGKVYAFNVNYVEEPTSLTIDLRRQPPYAPVTFQGVSLNSKEIEQYAGIIAAGEPFLKKGRFHKHGLDLFLEGVYIKDDVLFFRYHLKNSTGIGYDAASTRFYIRDKKRSKRTAVQDKESDPLLVQKSGKPEDALGQTIIVAFPKFTIAESKYFVTEIMEQDGDRNPVSGLDQDILLRAKALH